MKDQATQDFLFHLSARVDELKKDQIHNLAHIRDTLYARMSYKNIVLEVQQRIDLATKDFCKAIGEIQQDISDFAIGDEVFDDDYPFP